MIIIMPGFDGKEEVERTRDRRVCCAGASDDGGHPAVYLVLNEEGFVICPYCSQRFELYRE